MLGGILSRLCRCLAGGPREREPSAKPVGDAVGEERAEAEGQAPGENRGSVVDDLTAIRGIGITMQNRLNRAGITTYAQLAEAKPEHMREVLGGKLSRGAKVEAWISQARELVASK
jgi:predicted flap endonuclease-1-like 5' DNA nuclease